MQSASRGELTCGVFVCSPEQVIKSKTENGFIPNGATGGGKSQDRTEPMMGAKVLLEIYKKYGDLWLVELLFDDLLDWNNWSLRERTMEPLDLIVLGTSQGPMGVCGVAMRPGQNRSFCVLHP